MTDHVQKFKPGAAVTFTATTAITGGRLVEVTGSRAVGTAGVGSKKVLGPAGHDAKVGESVTVFIRGLHDLVAAGAIVAGATVAVAANGKAATGAGLGLAISSAAADGDLVQVIIGGSATGEGGE